MPNYNIPEVTTPNAMNSIGQILNFARGATELQKARATMESEIESAAAAARRATAEAGVSEQTAQPRIAIAGEQAKQAQTQTETQAFEQRRAMNAQAMQIAGGLIGDKRIQGGDMKSAMEALAEAEDQMIASGVPKHIAKAQMSPLYLTATRDPAKLYQGLKNIVVQGQGAGTQGTAVTPSGPQISSGQQNVQYNTNPLAGGTGQPNITVPQQITPSEQETVQFHPVTRSPVTVTKDVSGRVTGMTGTPTGAGAPQALQPGQAEDIPILTNLRAGVNQAALKVGESHFNNQQILKLADETNTGTAAQILQNLKGGYAAIPWTADTATNFNSLGHFIALEAANNAKAMGAGTDAAREMSHQATVSGGWTRDAIKNAAKINDALSTGLDYFNRGMEKAVASSGGNILAVRPFQNEWAKNFDPDVYRYANALEAKDTKEIEKILGPEGSQKRAAKALALSKKSEVLYRLSNEGR